MLQIYFATVLIYITKRRYKFLKSFKWFYLTPIKLLEGLGEASPRDAEADMRKTGYEPDSVQVITTKLSPLWAQSELPSNQVPTFSSRFQLRLQLK